MSISDKTRKVLWGRSANRCAICKNELVIDATADDDESVVAEESHIISSQPSGPRYDSSYPQEKLDSYHNLILLCRTHHKMVDDQTATFTTDRLRQMKSNHELWVQRKLTEEAEQPQVRIRRVEKNVPAFLFRVTTGKEILDIVANAMAFAFDHDELKSQEEVEIVGGFLQLAQDWGEFSNELEAGGRVQTAYELTEALQTVEKNGFFVFGGREVQRLEGGAQTGSSSWPVAILRVLREDNQSIMQTNLDTKEDAEQLSTNPA